MRMYYIHCLNPISPKGNALWTEKYVSTAKIEEATAVVVRSASMHDMEFPQGLAAIARAGAGVNNIPVEQCAQKGIVVFNTPGANANSVKEMVLCGMLLGSRDVVGGIRWVQSIREEQEIAKKVEKGKSRFAGNEIKDKNLGVIGLGAIGGLVANDAVKLGLQVCGFDPHISIHAAWHLDSRIRPVKTLEELYANCDLITLHTPLTEATRKMLNAEALGAMKDGVVILNFARAELVDEDAMEEALRSGKVKRYVTDFPTDRIAGLDGVIAIPHLGASTAEAEENCAQMAVKQLMDYLENGNIVNSVNFPACDMGVCTKPGRITVLHRNVPDMIRSLTAAVAMEHINISDMLNRSRGDYAYTMIDMDAPASEGLVSALQKVEGVFRVRVIR